MKNPLFVTILFLVSCASTTTPKQDVPIHDLDTDFPVTDTLTGTLKQTFSITKDIASCFVKDTILYIEERNSDTFGHYYSINSGQEIATLIGKGRAANEMLNLSKIYWEGDSIQFADLNTATIKLVAWKDMLTKSSGERNAVTYKLPEGLMSRSVIKLENGNLFGTYSSYKENADDSCRYFIYDGEKVSFFGEISLNLYEPKSGEVFGIPEIKAMSDTGSNSMKMKGDTIVYVMENGIYLNVIDVNKKSVDFERCYDKYEGSDCSFGAKSRYRTLSMSFNDEVICCVIYKKRRVKSNEKTIYVDDYYVLVFDWKLNPLKKYYLPGKGKFALRTDCKSVYYLDTTDDETLKLYEYELK